MPTTRLTGTFRRSEKTGRDLFVTVENGYDEEITYVNDDELEARRVELRDKAVQSILDDLAYFKARLGEEEKRVFVQAQPQPEPADLKKCGINLD